MKRSCKKSLIGPRQSTKKANSSPVSSTSITHTSMEGSVMRNLRMFQSLCGQEALSNVLLTTTQWSNVNPAEAELRETRLRNQDFWGALIDKGATLRRFNGTRESGLELIHKLMPNTRKPLDIQDQIVEQNMILLQTKAGKCVNEELIALEKKFKETMESLEKQFREIIKAKDDEIKVIRDEMRALKKEQAKDEDKLEKAEVGMGALAELHAAGVKKREAREGEEKARTCGQAVIAVAIKDIAITADITGVLTSYKTRGRLIFDVNSHEEFKSDTFEIIINYQLNMLPGIRVYTNTSRGEFNGLIGDIVLHGVHYRWKSGASVSIDNEEFVIFSKD